MNRVQARRRLGSRRGGQCLAGHHSGHSPQKLDEPGPAGVDDSRLAQDVELLRSPSDGLLPVPHEVDEEVAERLRFGDAVERALDIALGP